MMDHNAPVSIATIDIIDAEIENIAFNEIPLTSMSKNTRRQLSGLLNARKYLRSEGGFCRDWRGIAELTQDRYYFDESAIVDKDPTSIVLEAWCKSKPKDATFANLQKILGEIDRWDASDDIFENLVEDARNFKAKKARIESKFKPQVVQLPVEDNDYKILTVDDKKLAELGLPPQIYDAFVLYADVDAKYAAEIKKRLEEDDNNNFKLCFKDDLLAGEAFIHVALTELIEERCNRLIVIFTKEFCKSPEDEFLVGYTHASQIQNRKRKIIPLIYDKDVEVPRSLKYVIRLEYNSIMYWERLAGSIRILAPIESPKIKDSKLSINDHNVPSEPSPLNEIPSINITPAQDDDAEPTVKEARNFKKNTKNRNTSNFYIANENAHQQNSEIINSKIQSVKGFVLRHAHSTSQLNGKNYKENNLSSSDVSIKSNNSDTLKKKKKRWPSKILKRVFSRSNNKLQTAV